MFHIARHTIDFARTEPFPIHTHDGFSEVFWISGGTGEHVANGKVDEIQAGDLCFIRESDTHVIECAKERRLGISNVAFPSDILHFLRERYFEGMADPCWAAGQYPRKKHLDKIALEQLNARAIELASQPRTRFHIERFLINLYAAEIGAARHTFPDHTPEWLQSACVRLHQPEHFGRGAEAFYFFCGRSPEHATRVIQKFLGKTPTEYINEIRLEHAAHALAMTSLSIEEIAAQIGYKNLGYFYRLFRARYKTTPRIYRSKCKATFT